ncbi:MULTISPECIES: 3-oxoacyl-ACP reductase FabG [unclassified Rummeliibacillus]|uniref:3-oxoacyl-ACP reductase FabG n=1 Tax=unclassified Rummeliibacillus TaxID=2622809 RepID=UPI000E65FD23|nr:MULTISPECIES: 3-oxoacyl-ACP reductase FabG [unclassified Rummeliibacillus]RIJ62958.1 3-oxoacyl-ACP reductase FabG [Rummeliibacillus sp. POC4]RPJ95590.1 3-oxoacyl-ACP reductase FabG [Rummeliibacillus sp. TYF005]
MRLQDKVAIITGGASGIGLAAVKRFANEGATVIIADYNSDAGKKVEEELLKENLKVSFYQINVADKESITNVVSEILKEFNKIDILVNNAGITNDAMLWKMTAEQFDQVIDVNLKGVFNCTQAVVPSMIANGYGKIINTSSVSGVYGNIGQTNYAATKAAVVGMTKTWAKELGRKGINVNAVAPGFTRTPMVEKMPEKVLNHMESIVSLNRLGIPDDIANAYLFLASDESNYITGHVLQVDGGIMM